VLQAAQLLEIQQISGDCGGTMACATCHVVMDQDGLERLARTDNLQSEEEKDILELAPQHSVMSRLSCQIRLTPALDGLVIYVPNKSYEN
jgi:2Fe-2S ferredoxin